MVVIVNDFRRKHCLSNDTYLHHIRVCGLFMGLSSTIIYTSELILWFHYLCSQCYAAQHSYLLLVDHELRDVPKRVESQLLLQLYFNLCFGMKCSPEVSL